ncbi:chorismate synthase [uncultured Ruminococcus sp.]|uniref:chorismate synthase n=1 Tax=uncultured Ruminococcus sp. TaxID=165186 RepID=UPI0025E4531D|nr:chorismate synthase [uncultured Ruminococcus sp.]
MKNTFGSSVSITVFGESHGTAIGAVLDGLASGIEVNEEFIAQQMKLRQSVGALSTPRREGDKVRIVSGVFNGRTTGTPITFIIENEDTRSKDYGELAYKARPGHADYSAQMKYHGFQDFRGGGHFSGRITAGVVAAGAVAISALRKKGIKIATHILSCGGVFDRSFEDINADIDRLNTMEFAVLDDEKAQAMQAAITAAKEEGDSVGGRLETIVTGVPAGVGEPWFDTIESVLSHALFGIPAVKGVEFGAGFAAADMRGSQCNDNFRTENRTLTAATNNNGGILGGITTGMPILFRTAIKPTPSIYKEQQTIDMRTMDNTTLQIKGRHDPAIVHRARVVADSMTALVLCDQLSQRFGTDWLAANS